VATHSLKILSTAVYTLQTYLWYNWRRGSLCSQSLPVKTLIPPVHQHSVNIVYGVKNRSGLFWSF